ncbi:MAG: Txe/YoeB family addiction module toxin, partial [Clostridiales bacterium]|nr:Txe/YoeB family addiction module toxin [Clostridiales bacterium]
MSRPLFSERAWDELLYWFSQDKKTIKKIARLIDDISRNGAMQGEGKPEALKGDLQGLYSRRINEKDRLVYRVTKDNVVEIVSCKGHY